MSPSLAHRASTVVASIVAGLVAWLAWSWSPLLVAGTPLAELGMVVQVAAVMLTLSALDPVATRALQRRGVHQPEEG